MPVRPFALAAVALSAALAVPASAADAEHDPQASCTLERQNGVLVYAGVATVPAAHAAHVTRLTLTCTYVNALGRTDATNAAPGPVVAVAGSGLLGAAPTTVCTSATALYDDGHAGSFPTTCT